MKQIYHLSTCYTCKRIITELKLSKKGFEFFDLKDKPLTEEELSELQKMSGMSAEELFNKRAMKYKKENFKTDDDYKQGILKEYTFIKRPLIIINDEVFVGNAPLVVEAAREALLK